MLHEEKQNNYKNMEYENLDKVIENTIIIKGQDGIEKHYNESEMRKQFAPAKATDAQWNYFKTVAQSQGLDPYDKEIYMSIIDEYEGFGENRKKVGEKVVPLIGYLVYVKRSLASGKMKSAPQVELVTPNEVNPDTWYADYSVERSDIEGVFKWRVWMKEVNKKRALWNIQPKFQLVKTTLSQGTRVWFSDVVGGFPYTPEEVTQDESSVEVDNSPEEGKVEPSVEEKARLEEEKKKALVEKQSKADSFESLEKLDKWFHGLEAKLKDSILKDDIKTIYNNRHADLVALKLAELTGLSEFDVKEFIKNDNEGMRSAEISESLAGNKDAVVQLKSDITRYIDSKLRDEQDSKNGATEGDKDLELPLEK